jgi:hypothetical protein
MLVADMEYGLLLMAVILAAAFYLATQLHARQAI